MSTLMVTIGEWAVSYVDAQNCDYPVFNLAKEKRKVTERDNCVGSKTNVLTKIIVKVNLMLMYVLSQNKTVNINTKITQKRSVIGLAVHAIQVLKSTLFRILKKRNTIKRVSCTIKPFIEKNKNE